MQLHSPFCSLLQAPVLPNFGLPRSSPAQWGARVARKVWFTAVWVSRSGTTEESRLISLPYKPLSPPVILHSPVFEKLVLFVIGLRPLLLNLSNKNLGNLSVFISSRGCCIGPGLVPRRSPLSG